MAIIHITAFFKIQDSNQFILAKIRNSTTCTPTNRQRAHTR
uniref:Uncharacterized protein n=1 Tax=Arundo donax TaxID=35708 RepID=A0A0A9BNU3_ARUDO